MTEDNQHNEKAERRQMRAVENPRAQA